METADNFVKYAKPGTEERSRQRALERYQSARDLAGQIGDKELVRIATLRISDLNREAVADATFADGSSFPREAASAAAESPPDPAAVTSSPVPARDRVPPGQSLTKGWPVLHEGRIPRFDRKAWRLRVWGEAEREVIFTYDELQAVGLQTIRSDFHCVTGWSKLDNTWTGVWFRDVVAPAMPRSSARHVTAHCAHGYTANIPFDRVMEEGFFAWGHNGTDLAPEHGFPLRLVVPSLYAWKSAKWVEGVELMAADRRGFWEVRGYHNRADPWLQERYSYQE
jgi:DMSO/TMAO reductase YedYZ molybdopterin-dependent catalytic subunit